MIAAAPTDASETAMVFAVTVMTVACIATTAAMTMAVVVVIDKVYQNVD